MQSAWREWFEERKQPLATLPDGSEDFRDELLPVTLPEEALMDESEPEALHTEPLEEAVQEEMVVISRIRNQTEPRVSDLSANESTQEEKVELHRSYTTVNSPRKDYGDEIREIKQAQPIPVRVPRPIATKETTSNGVVRALLIAISLFVAIVALIGTGNAEQLLSGTSLDFGAQKEVMDFLGGKSTYESSL